MKDRFYCPACRHWVELPEEWSVSEVRVAHLRAHFRELVNSHPDLKELDSLFGYWYRRGME